jgi:hypothetical protein
MRHARWISLGLLAVMLWSGRAMAAPPTDPVDPAAPTDTVPVDPAAVPVDPAAPTTTLAPGQLPPAQGPLVVVPTGCFAPTPARAVFIGRLTNTDVPPTTARFVLDRVLAGDVNGYSGGNLVDVHYGEETRFLTIGQRYIVGVVVDPTTGLLVSTVREAAPLFGGDAVIGANDSDIDCPRVEDPVRTLNADGSAVDTGVLTPLDGQGSSLLSAILRPFVIAFAVLLLLVLVKQSAFAVGRSLRDMGRLDPLPPAPARPVRRHQPASPGDQPRA